MADEDATSTIRPDLPTGRVKKIVKLDQDINKVIAEKQRRTVALAGVGPVTIDRDRSNAAQRVHPRIAVDETQPPHHSLALLFLLSVPHPYLNLE
ncbi:hypothetical protein NL676_033013 [Syzygium grande]|nr:hypothetical protein NL676_033013 [Syzygium grande]